MMFKNTQVKTLSVLNGFLAVGPRPASDEVEELIQKFDCVITLQLENERVDEISQLCQSFNVRWLWVPIRAVNWELIRDQSLFISILEGISQVKNLLEHGSTLFIHCAAGIHRTGFFTYILLRSCNISEANTLSSLASLRPIILKKIGQHRLDLAEEFFQSSTGNPSQIPYYEIPNIRQGDFLNPSLTVLFFLKVLFSENLAILQFCATTLDFYKIVIGGELIVKCDEDFIWKVKRQTGHKEGKVRTLENCDLVLEEFLKSCTENEVKIVVGRNCFFDKEFIIRCCPRTNSILHYRIIDLNCAQMAEKESMSIYDDLNELMAIRNNIIQHKDIEMFHKKE